MADDDRLFPEGKEFGEPDDAEPPRTNTKVLRQPDGRWLPGSVPNPTGRPLMDPEIRAMLRAATPAACSRLVEALDAVLDGGKPDHDMRVKAAVALLDRAYGKPTQAVTGEDGGPIKVLSVIVLPSESEEP